MTKTMLLDIDNDGNSANDILYIKTSQEYSTISNITCVSSLVFVSNTLPIERNNVSYAIFSDGIQTNSKFGDETLNVITDLATNEMAFKPNIYYVPSGEYRMISLKPSSEIRNLDISVFWRSETNQLVPFYLQNGASASIKLMFRRKT